MTYQELIEKSEEAFETAKKYYFADEMDLARFYFNVAKGYENKAKNLPIEKA